MTFIYKTNGIYLGFFHENNIFNRDGVYLGWLENEFAWGFDGQYRGQLTKINNNFYILRNIYSAPPIPKTPRSTPPTPSIPNPPPNITPINPNIGFKDAF
ncbi:MAG: 4-fold beta flower protein [Patescibacteria group bacterium]